MEAALTPDLRDRLRRAILGHPTNSDVTDVTGVTASYDVTEPAVTCDNSLKLQGLRRLRQKTNSLPNIEERRNQGVTLPLQLDEADIEERVAMAVEVVPEEFARAWVLFQIRAPEWCEEQIWRRAIDDVAQFFDGGRGHAAAFFGWQSEDIFGREGLAFWLAGELTRGPGVNFIETESGRKFARQT